MDDHIKKLTNEYLIRLSATDMHTDTFARITAFLQEQIGPLAEHPGEPNEKPTV